MKTQNARIVSSKIVIKDHGILTHFLNLDVQDGYRIGFGGYMLGSKMHDYIKALMETLECRDFEKLKG